ncbi:uncharacterized protein LOC144444344 [Glandiceps talaboti]
MVAIIVIIIIIIIFIIWEPYEALQRIRVDGSGNTVCDFSNSEIEQSTIHIHLDKNEVKVTSVKDTSNTNEKDQPSCQADCLSSARDLLAPDDSPVITIIKTPNRNDGVCNGFLTPRHPHTHTDHCVALAVTKNKGSGDLLMCDFSTGQDIYLIKILEVNRHAHDASIDKKENQAESSLAQTLQPKNKLPRLPRENNIHRSLYYRIWNGWEFQTVLQESRGCETILKPWIQTYWFRFFGQSAIYHVTFGLYYNKGCLETATLIDKMQISVRTSGKRPRKNKKEMTTLVTYGVSRLKRPKIMLSEKYAFITDKLWELSFSGRWQDVDIMCDELCRKMKNSTTTDLQITILCHHGILACLRKDFDKVEELMGSARLLLPRAENQQLLEARIEYLMGYSYKCQRLPGKAQEYFESVFQILLGMESCQFHGDCLYNMACIKYDLISLQANPPNELFKDVVADLGRSVDLMSSDLPKVAYYPRQRALVRMANALTDCDTCAGRTRNRDEAFAHRNVREARKIIQNIENNELISCECCILQAKAHCCFRLKQFEKAEQYAIAALRINESREFNSEISQIEHLLLDIRLNRNVDYSSINISELDEELSTGEYGDESATLDG